MESVRNWLTAFLAKLINLFTTCTCIFTPFTYSRIGRERSYRERWESLVMLLRALQVNERLVKPFVSSSSSNRSDRLFVPSIPNHGSSQSKNLAIHFYIHARKFKLYYHRKFSLRWLNSIQSSCYSDYSHRRASQ